MRKIALLFLFAVPALAQNWSTILAPTRATDWTQAGISGGIPNFTTQCGSTINPGASAATIISAISACSGTNKYVKLAAGTFNLSSAIRNQGVGGVELRGSGPQSTFLHFSAGSTCQGGNGNCLVGFESNNMNYPGGSPSFHNVSSGLSAGSTSITLDSASGIAIGQILIMDQCDTGLAGSTGSATCSGTPTDNNQMYVCEYSTTSSDRSCAFNHGNGTSAERLNRGQAEVFTVTNVVGNVVTIDTPLVNPNWSTGLFPQVWNMTTTGLPISNVGIRDMTIDGSATSNTHGASFFGTGPHWITNVIIRQLQLESVYDTQTTHGVYQSNYLYGCGQFAGNDASGINLSINGTMLVANNVFQGCINSVIFNGPGGGNVVIANFNTYAWSAPAYWAQHAAGVHYNLYEENVGHQWFSDQIHGPVMMNTLYRNFFPGWQSCANNSTGCDANTNLWPIADLSYNRYLNVVANVLGTPPVQGASGSGYSVTLDFQYFTFSSTGVGPGTYIYNIGSGNPGNAPTASAQWPHDPIVESTMMRWGNYDVKNSAVLECTAASTPIAACAANERGNGAPTYPGLASPSTTFPASFYYSSRPLWWSGSIPFPAIGPDISPGNVGICTGTLNTPGHYSGVAATSGSQCTGTSLATGWGGHINAIPAMDCFLNTLHGPPDGSGGILAFDAASCYPSTPSVALTVTKVGTGTGTVTGTNCSTNSYSSGTSIGTCTATPSGGSTLTSLVGTGSASCSGSTCPSFSIAANSTITATFQGTVATPVISTQSGSAPQWITVTDATPASSIYCSVDSSPPTSALPAYTHHLWFANTFTLKCIATATGYTNSAPASSLITIATQPTSFNMSTVFASSSPIPFPFNSRVCCGTNVASMEPLRNNYNLTALHNYQSQSAGHGAQTWYTIQGFPSYMTGLSSGTVESAPPTDLLVSAPCQGPMVGITTTNCMLKEFVTKLMMDCTGRSTIPVTPVPCVGIDVVEPMNEFNTDSVPTGGPPPGSSTGWTGTYDQMAVVANDVCGIVFTWSSTTQCGVGSTSGIVGFHSNAENAHFEIALETVMAKWANLPAPVYLPTFVSWHGYPARQKDALNNPLAPVPFPTSIISDSDPSCSTSTPSVWCYISIKDQPGTIAGAAVLQNAAVVKWAKFLPIYSTEGGFGQLQQLCTLGSGTLLCQAYVSEYMLAMAASNQVQVAMFYAAYDPPCGATNWGCIWQTSVGTNSGWLRAFTQTQSWLNSAVVTGPLTSTSITGGLKWTLPITIGGNPAEITFCDAFLAPCTTTSSFTTQQDLSGVTGAFTGTLTQSPLLLTNAVVPRPITATSGVHVSGGVGVQ